MIARLSIVFGLALLPGCRQLLEIPSDVSELDGDVGDGALVDGSPGQLDGAAQDASGGASDAAADAGVCGTGRGIGFKEPGDFVGWSFDQGEGCEIAFEDGALFVRQITVPFGVCRGFRDLVAPMVDYGLRINVPFAGDPDMNLVYSVLLAGPGDIRSRRRIRIERDGGFIRLGECAGDSGCQPDLYGSLPFDATEHQWWGIVHDGASQTIYFELGGDDEMLVRPPGTLAVPGIADDLVECVGVELGSYEADDAGISAFDDLVAGRG